tara:strand:- start:850 stop:1101 length:252 start_codon:yes stop_codon:yes gene_type:complete
MWASQTPSPLSLNFSTRSPQSSIIFKTRPSKERSGRPVGGTMERGHGHEEGERLREGYDIQTDRALERTAGQKIAKDGYPAWG